MLIRTTCEKIVCIARRFALSEHGLTTRRRLLSLSRMILRAYGGSHDIETPHCASARVPARPPLAEAPPGALLQRAGGEPS